RLRVPGRAGLLSAPAGEHASGAAEDRSLNVWVRFQVQLVDESIRAVRFQAYGCPHFIAAADWMAERLEGQAAHRLAEPAGRAAQAALGVPTEKLGKLLVLENALAACLSAAKGD
ncbi:MAG TPA: iron-sulfur cluster assembly scaffold protein, partial [Gammaproteobacteria bacterium]|nr:iron-sulfur cluster assembly scaffold protein [Gammaproteobacteria bacterium]